MSEATNAIETDAPGWCLAEEYKSLKDTDFQRDFNSVGEAVVVISEKSSRLKDILTKLEQGELNSSPYRLSDEEIALSQEVWNVVDETAQIIWDLKVYLGCILSTQSNHEEAKAKQSQLESLLSQYNEELQTLELVSMLMDESDLETFLGTETFASHRFRLENKRRLKDFRLSSLEEKLLSALEQSGFHNWGKLFTNLYSASTVEMEMQDGNRKAIGLAQASSYLFGSNAKLRRSAELALDEVWKTHETSLAAILNSIAGWRHKVCEKRSRSKPMDFLVQPLHQGRISRKCIDTLSETCINYRESSWETFAIKRKVFGKNQLSKSDLLASAPLKSKGNYTFGETVEIIKNAFYSFSQDLGDFVDMMLAKNWVEAGCGPNRGPGAYCTKFVRSKSPRVYMTFTGSMKDVVTLAHELGHAYHSWVMRDLDFPEIRYPMTLAETASTFAESLVKSYLEKNAKSEDNRKAIAWEYSADVKTYLVDTISRYTLEKKMYEAKATTELTPKVLKDITRDTFSFWYGEYLEEETMYWASKMHFYMTHIGFYNYPYTFGYLFSIALFQMYQEQGNQFEKKYIALLRETGRMLPKDLIEKYLSMDIETPEFWTFGLKEVSRRIGFFKENWG